MIITGRRRAELDRAADELGDEVPADEVGTGVTALRGDVADLADRGTGLDVQTYGS